MRRLVATCSQVCSQCSNIENKPEASFQRGLAASFAGAVHALGLRRYGGEKYNAYDLDFSTSGAKREATKINVSVSAISSVDTALTSGVTATLIIE